MDIMTRPDIIEALASDQRRRFAVEAEHSRSIRLVQRGRGHELLARWFAAACARLRRWRGSVVATPGETTDRNRFEALRRSLADATRRGHAGKPFSVPS